MRTAIFVISTSVAFESTLEITTAYIQRTKYQSRDEAANPQREQPEVTDHSKT